MTKLDLMMADIESAAASTRAEEKSIEKSKNSRVLEKKVKEDYTASGGRRKKSALLSALQDSRLPNVTPLDSTVHLFWGSTSQGTWPDIATLIQNGCEYASVEDVAEGIQVLMQHNSDGSQCIRQNEMVLMKTFREDWEEALTQHHHIDPQNRADGVLKDYTERLRAYGGDSREQVSPAEENMLEVTHQGRRVKKQPPASWTNLSKGPTIKDYFGTN